jgi:hypothetical protein
MTSETTFALQCKLCALLLLGLVPGTAAPAEVDVREIIRRVVAADESNWRLARQYGFSERVDARRVDSQGRIESGDVKTYDVILLDGSPYRRLSGRNDQALPPRDEKKEQHRLARSIAERRNETPGQRALRIIAYEIRPEWHREAWRELPQAFDFRLVAEEKANGRSQYAIEATPREGYQPHSRTAKVLAQLKGKLWVDKQDYRIVRADVEVVDTISVGLFLFRLARGSRAAFEQFQVSENVWLPRRVQVSASARVGLLKVVRVEQEVTYSNCRPAQTASVVISRLKSR